MSGHTPTFTGSGRMTYEATKRWEANSWPIRVESSSLVTTTHSAGWVVERRYSGPIKTGWRAWREQS